MKVTETLRNQLITAAKVDRDEKLQALDTARKAFNEADGVYLWANSLKVGGELGAPNGSYQVPNPSYATSKGTVAYRYYVASRSGGTKGHYIERFASGEVNCSCPGFINRGYCWASNEIKRNPLSQPRWNKSVYIFNDNKAIALRYAQ